MDQTITLSHSFPSNTLASGLHFCIHKSSCMLSVTCTWEEGTQHRQEGLKKPLNRINGISSILTTSNSVCFEASLYSLKVLPKSTAGTLLELRLISERYVSIHSAAPLSPITSNTNEANAPLPPFLCPFPLHLPNLPPPPSSL